MSANIQLYPVDCTSVLLTEQSPFVHPRAASWLLITDPTIIIIIAARTVPVRKWSESGDDCNGGA